MASPSTKRLKYAAKAVSLSRRLSLGNMKCPTVRVARTKHAVKNITYDELIEFSPIEWCEGDIADAIHSIK
jgi:hypothetical protein